MVKMLRQSLRMLGAATKPQKKPFTVIIEGNIGSGKTTFLNHFEKYENVCVLSEPVDLWRNCAGHNLLAYFYENPQQWSFAFQSYVQLTMLQHHLSPTQLPIKLLERSLYSARYCFVEKLFKDGVISPQSLAVLNEWFKYIMTNFDVYVDLIVYLQTSPEIVYERVLTRNRQEEKSISLQYLQQLHEMHENWLHHKVAFNCTTPVITLNADLDKTFIIKEYEKCKNCMLNKIAVSL